MIIGSALGRLFNGLNVDLTIDGNDINRNVQYHYGDNKELIKWVVNQNNGNKQKYPLVWYVVSPFHEEIDFKVARTKLIILQNTKIDWFNTTRSVRSYDDIIEPVWLKVKRLIELNQHIQVMGVSFRKYHIKDEPSYGLKTDDIRLSQNDFSSKTKSGDESVTIDVVDGRIIDLEFRINTKCI